MKAATSFITAGVPGMPDRRGGEVLPEGADRRPQHLHGAVLDQPDLMRVLSSQGSHHGTFVSAKRMDGYEGDLLASQPRHQSPIMRLSTLQYGWLRTRRINGERFGHSLGCVEFCS